MCSSDLVRVDSTTGLRASGGGDRLVHVRHGGTCPGGLGRRWDPAGNDASGTVHLQSCQAEPLGTVAVSFQSSERPVLLLLGVLSPLLQPELG